jgi:protein MAK11
VVIWRVLIINCPIKAASLIHPYTMAEVGSSSVKRPFLRLAACSYEGSLFGWKIIENEEKNGLTEELVFGFNVTAGSLKALSISSDARYLATGGYDERIRVFDIQKNRSVGELTHHSDDITCLEFFRESFLFSGSKDGTICVWRLKDWVCIHTLTEHTGSILSLSVHPTGKLCLAVDSDKGLRIWNLLTGTCSYTKRLTSLSNDVLWSSDGTYFLLKGDNLLEVTLNFV